MITLRSRGPEDTRAIAACIARLSRPRDIIVLTGEMGAGKTMFVTGFAHEIGVGNDDHVSSPTFTLVHTYDSGRIPLHHADLYRLASLGEVADLGLREAADLGAVVLVEWGDAALEVLGSCLVIALHHDESDDDARDVVISVEGHQWDSRWPQLSAALSRWGAS